MISCWAKVTKYRKSSSPKQDIIVRWCKVAMMMCQQGSVIVCWSGASWRRKNNLCSSLITVTLMLEKETCYHYYRKHMRQQFQTICNVKSDCVGLKVQDQHPYRIRRWTDNSIFSPFGWLVRFVAGSWRSTAGWFVWEKNTILTENLRLFTTSHSQMNMYKRHQMYRLSVGLNEIDCRLTSRRFSKFVSLVYEYDTGVLFYGLTISKFGLVKVLIDIDRKIYI